MNLRGDDPSENPAIIFSDRTIMALWKARSLTAQQMLQIAEEQSNTESTHTEENGCSDVEDIIRKRVYSSLRPIQVSVSHVYTEEMCCIC